MSQAIGLRYISQTAKLGHRLIKFRYGPQRDQQQTAGGQHSSAADGKPKIGQQASQEAIWDFQIPVRWRRAPLTEEECAVINNGGPL
ncbi:hypothetical protein ABEB36_003213 [Hypothenemus hampei]|uniref:Uncharacterized protein n=1 Tax=Hypothenemus hampei TaxID=57062 RepID=A0ABD1F8F6_HYPHA